MFYDEDEIFFDCPHCGAAISVLVDLSVSRQQYIEDCEICCRPIVITYETRGGSVSMLDARPAD
ncbi:MAG: CPXCG motif-containing cysteine-rich protein [Chloroflexota bacterium]